MEVLRHQLLVLPGLGPLELRAGDFVVEVLRAEEEHDAVRDELRPDLQKHRERADDTM